METFIRDQILPTERDDFLSGLLIGYMVILAVDIFKFLRSYRKHLNYHNRIAAPSSPKRLPMLRMSLVLN